MDTAAWTELITRYYNGCSAGDLDLTSGPLHADVVHYFLAPNIGSAPVAGRDHLARYWRKVAAPIRARWVVDSLCAAGDQAVIEWTMFWDTQAGDRVATRGAEWFVARDGLIAEIRSYYTMESQVTELDGFPYRERGYSVLGHESSELHPGAAAFGSAS